jgi:molecular chaperone GrpE
VDSNKTPETWSPVSDMIARWRQAYVAVLKENHELRVAARKNEAAGNDEARSFLLSFLGVLDSYDKTLAYLSETVPEEDRKARRILQSFRLQRKQLAAVLRQMGVTPMDMQQADFIPGLHKAVGVVQMEDVPEGRVVSVEKEGYFWKSEILRSAEVIVSSQDEAE